MTILQVALVFAGLAGITQSAWSQQTSTSQRGILGYLDSRTGAFRPLVQASAEGEQAKAATASPTTGKLVFVFSITIASTLATSETITCSGNASVIEIANGTALTIEEAATVMATRSGSKASCTVTIPYSWSLTFASTDTVGLQYTITAGSTVGVARLSLQSLPSIKIPASGSTTTQDISATI
jgi:hypothetical protein